jgi:hypothetical protein
LTRRIEPSNILCRTAWSSAAIAAGSPRRRPAVQSGATTWAANARPDRAAVLIACACATCPLQATAPAATPTMASALSARNHASVRRDSDPASRRRAPMIAIVPASGRPASEKPELQVR